MSQCHWGGETCPAAVAAVYDDNNVHLEEKRIECKSPANTDISWLTDSKTETQRGGDDGCFATASFTFMAINICLLLP